MKELLHQLAGGAPLSADQATEAFEQIMTGAVSEAQTAALLSLIALRGATVDELVGAATVMRRRAVSVTVPDGCTVVDTCGTGGDESGTFNISTGAAIVAAAAGREAGLVVAKHGNRSVTSNSGSSQVLEALGVKLAVNGQTHSQCLTEAGLCFCFAPSHHPAMKHAAGVRRELGFRTIFNLVGPLTNPAGAARQVVGVYRSELTEPIAEALNQLDARQAMVVHGRIPDPNGTHVDGLDELSTCGPNRISHLKRGEVQTYELRPEELEVNYSHPSALRAESVEDSARLIQKVLAGDHGPAREIVALNAAAALVVGDVAGDLLEGLERAFEAIDAGKAQRTLDELVRLTTADPTPAT